MSTGKNETELSRVLHVFLNITYQKNSSRPQKPTGLGVRRVFWLGPPALILDWVGVDWSWGGKQLAWWWLRAFLIAMESTGGRELSRPRQVTVGGSRAMGSRGRLGCMAGSQLSHAAVTTSRWATTANILPWNKVWQTRAFPVISCPWCLCMQLTCFKWTWRRVMYETDVSASKHDTVATWVKMIFQFIESGQGNKNI